MILECEKLSKNYGGLRALDELNLKLESGKVLESHDNSILYKNKRYASSI